MDTLCGVHLRGPLSHRLLHSFSLRPFASGAGQRSHAQLVASGSSVASRGLARPCCLERVQRHGQKLVCGDGPKRTDAGSSNLSCAMAGGRCRLASTSHSGHSPGRESSTTTTTTTAAAAAAAATTTTTTTILRLYALTCPRVIQHVYPTPSIPALFVFDHTPFGGIISLCGGRRA